MKSTNLPWSAPALAMLSLLLLACTPLIASYNADAYKNATNLKAETGALIEKSGEPFAQNKPAVETLTTRINAAYEYAAGLPSNRISAQQWQILRNPSGGLYGEFVARWREQGTTSRAYRAAKKQQLDRAFDFIICLEANKQESRPCSAPPAQAGAGAD
jgi:hypothetical protein